MTQEQHIQNLRDRREEALDEMDGCESEVRKHVLWKRSEKLWDEVQLAESELAAKREDERQHRLGGKP